MCVCVCACMHVCVCVCVCVCARARTDLDMKNESVNRTYRKTSAENAGRARDTNMHLHVRDTNVRIHVRDTNVHLHVRDTICIYTFAHMCTYVCVYIDDTGGPRPKMWGGFVTETGLTLLPRHARRSSIPTCHVFVQGLGFRV